ncbi:tape measure protein [Candidatus Pacearchaeota archaeon]|nr:tape measure protein [Candidatus Pacearchaeota archaeon]
MASETEIERLVVRLVGDVSKYQKMVEEVSSSTREFTKLEQRINHLEDSLKRSNDGVGNLNSSLARSAQASDMAGIKLTALGYSLSQIGSTIRGLGGGLGTEMLRAAKDFEKTSISMRALVGNAEDADRLLRNLTDFAAKTPFEMPTLLGATKMLMQYGTKADEILPILKSIGDVTGGVDAQKVMQMSYAFGQMSSSGRLMGQDLLQMINAGFNPLSEIAKKTGKSVATLKKEMESGRITVTMVKEAFASASGKLDLMNKQSKSLEGLQSTLNDNIGIFKRKLGDELVPAAKAFVDWQGRMTEGFDNLSKSSKTAIAYSAGAVEVFGIGMEKLSSVAMTLAAIKLSGMGTALLSIAPATIAASKATATWLNTLHSVAGTTQLMTGSAIAYAVAWRVGVYGAITAVTLSILDAASAQDKLNAAFAEGELLSSKFRKFESQRHEFYMQMPAGATEIQKREVYQRESERLGGKIKGSQKSVGAKESRLARMEGSFEEVWFWNEKNINQLKNEIKNDRAELEHLQGMAAEVSKLLNPTPEATAAGAEMIKQLDLREASLRKTTTETKMLEAANKGLSKAEMDIVRNREPQVLAAEMIAKLEEEAEQYGLTEKELEKYKLSLAGLPPALRQAVDAHIDLKYAAKESGKIIADIESTIKSLTEEIGVLRAGSKEQYLLNRGLEEHASASSLDLLTRKRLEKQIVESEANVRKAIETLNEEAESLRAGGKAQAELNYAMENGTDATLGFALAQAEANKKSAELESSTQKATEAFKEEARTESYFMKDRAAAVERLTIAERELARVRSQANQSKVEAARKALENLDKANVKNYNLAKQAEKANLPGAKEFAAQAKMNEMRDREQKGREEALRLAEKLLTPEQRFAKAQEFAREMLEKNIYTYEQYKKAIEEARAEKAKFDASGIKPSLMGSAESMWRLAEYQTGISQTASRATKASDNFLMMSPEELANPKNQQRLRALQARLTPQASRAAWQQNQLIEGIRVNNQGRDAEARQAREFFGSDIVSNESTDILKEIRDLNQKQLSKDLLEGIQITNASNGGGL